MKSKTLRIGIASYEEIKKRTLAIARGDYRPDKDEPKIWFSSFDSFIQAFTDKNSILSNFFN